MESSTPEGLASDVKSFQPSTAEYASRPPAGTVTNAVALMPSLKFPAVGMAIVATVIYFTLLALEMFGVFVTLPQKNRSSKALFTEKTSSVISVPDDSVTS